MKIPEDYKRYGTQLKNLDKNDFMLISDYRDIVWWFDFIDFPNKWKKDITAMVIKICNGDLEAMWLTEDSRYHDTSSIYFPLPYYRPNYWHKRNLPIYWIESNIEYGR